MREWFRMQVVDEDPATVDVYILDYIGDWLDQQISEFWGVEMGVTAKSFVEQLAGLSDSVRTIRVHINSPGGDVFAGLTIANALRDQRVTKGRTVETIVDGLAASIASVIFMAGAPARIADNGLLMLHNPWIVAIGNAQELAKAIESLGTVRDAIVASYRWHSELSAEEIGMLMDAETWLDAGEAVEKGFADEAVQGLRAAASIDPRGAMKLRVPERFSDRVKALLRPEDAIKVEAPPEPVVVPEVPVTPEVAAALVEPGRVEPMAPAIAAAEVIRLCLAGGLDREFAGRLIEEGAQLTADQVQARATAERGRREQASAREADIRALCSMSHLEELASDLVAGGMTVDQVRTHMTKLVAKLDKVEIDAGLNPDHGTRPRAVINPAQIYAERNRPRAN